MEHIQLIKDEIYRRIISLNHEIETQKDHPHQGNPYLIGLKCRRDGLKEALKLLQDKPQ